MDLQPISYHKHLQICGKKLKSTTNPQGNNIAGIVSSQFQTQNFLWFNVLTDLRESIIKYNTPLPRSAAVKRLFSMSAVILTVTRASLTSRNFQWLIFLMRNLDFRRVW